MYTQKVTIGLLVSCLVALLAIAGCGGGASSPLGNTEALNGNTGYESQAAQPEALVSDEMPTLRQASAPSIIEDIIAIDPIPDWFDTIFLALHDSLVSGDNVIDVLTPTYKSTSTTTESVVTGWHVGWGGTIIPEFGDALVLASEPGTTAYATFGFKDIPAGEEMLTITAHGYGVYGDHENNGLYIGIGNMEKGSYKWFGPYAPDADEYKVSTWGMDTVNSDGRGYITFAVYNGDQFTLLDMVVTVGNRVIFPGFDWDLVEIQPLIPPGGYFEMDLVDPEELPIPLPDPPLPGV